jgi:hypothetical protein
MALRNQPYFPLYVQDYLTDEKLNLCSLSAQGLYIKILCILHKQETYGSILFQQNNKQNLNKKDYFVSYLSKQLPVQKNEIEELLTELLDEGVLIMDDDILYQKRMLKDGKISVVRSNVAKDGGGSNLNKQYGKKGVLYLLSDKEKFHKIGVTSNLTQRVYQIRSKHKMSKLFDVVSFIDVQDMGKVEDQIKVYFGDNIRGEWINLPYNEVVDKFNLFQQNPKQTPKQNPENENENEVENVNKIENDRNSILLENLKIQFEKFRIAYPGKKRGIDTEFENFAKKHKDYKQVIPELERILKAQYFAKNKNIENGHWEENWQNLQTYINQRSWEIEIDIKPTKTQTTNGKQSVTDKLAAANNIIDGMFLKQ